MAICRSVKRGTVYVVAAGNESRNARRNRPAAYDEVITVSAMADYDGRRGGRGKSIRLVPLLERRAGRRVRPVQQLRS